MLDHVARCAAVFLFAMLGAGQFCAASPDGAQSSVAGSMPAIDQMAYSRPVLDLPESSRADFAAGRRLFRVVWRQKAFSDETATMVGLGPLFNQRSCAGCHVRNGRGRPPKPGSTGPANGMILRIVQPDAEPAESAHAFGAQVHDQAVPGVEHEARIAVSYRERPGQFADGTPYSLREPTYTLIGDVEARDLILSPRIPPAVIGGGLLMAVDDAVLSAMADPSDADSDGISGRLSLVGPGVVGRFGWKAERATLRDQVIEAAAEDLGLASDERPAGACTTAQAGAIADCAQTLELSALAIDQLTTYLRGVAAPARRNPDDPTVQRGEALFEGTGCTGCHAPVLRTGNDPLMPAPVNGPIAPYTDLLLHDMGAGLADRGDAGTETDREWRTAPLWGIGLSETVNGNAFYLHDGRARSLMEAVLWHGGEAAAARDAVIAMPYDDRAALIAFLRSL